LIHVEEFGAMTLGKTCRYCTPCELIIAHQDELEDQLTYSFRTISPEAAWDKYMVLGIVDKKIWQSGLQGDSPPLDDVLKHTTDFKRVLQLKSHPRGWYPAK
jgi:hypothetical protein